MLRKFIYLDEQALNGYVSALEDGLRSRRTTDSESQTSREGGLELKVARGQRGSSKTSADSIESLDTAEARFARFLQLAQEDPETSGWLDIASFDEFAEAGTGAIVDFECEIYVPQVSQFGSADMGGLGQLLDAIGDLAPLIDQNMEGMPSREELQAIKSFSAVMSTSDVIVIGEDDVSDWKIAGSLSRKILGDRSDQLSDYVRVCGKVKRTIAAGEYKPLLALPGMSLLSRDERRALERQGPEPGDDPSMYLEGPARMIDVLAIYA